jgi:hypothetical protein
MVKVTKGALSGERAEGYQSYTTNYGVGPSVTVRRGIPTTDLPTVGTSLAQKQQKDSFAVASYIYSKYNELQKDFFKQWWLLDKTVDPQHRLAKRILTGQRLAMHDIMRTISTSGETYPKPLGFCICAVDIWGNPAPEHELNITCPKLGNFEYKEKNDIYACFPPSSLSPKYEPYHLFFTDAADYCLLTAEQIHKIKTLSLDNNINFLRTQKRDYYVINHWPWWPIMRYSERGLPLVEYDMRLSLKWDNVQGLDGSYCMLEGCGCPLQYIPMPPGSKGNVTAWTIGRELQSVCITLYAQWPKSTRFYGVEISLDVVNLPC